MSGPRGTHFITSPPPDGFLPAQHVPLLNAFRLTKKPRGYRNPRGKRATTFPTAIRRHEKAPRMTVGASAREVWHAFMYSPTFSHPDYTVGPGIPPGLLTPRCNHKLLGPRFWDGVNPEAARGLLPPVGNCPASAELTLPRRPSSYSRYSVDCPILAPTCGEGKLRPDAGIRDPTASPKNARPRASPSIVSGSPSPATCNLQPGTWNLQPHTLESGAGMPYSLKCPPPRQPVHRYWFPFTCNLQPATWNLQPQTFTPRPQRRQPTTAYLFYRPYMPTNCP